MMHPSVGWSKRTSPSWSTQTAEFELGSRFSFHLFSATRFQLAGRLTRTIFSNPFAPVLSTHAPFETTELQCRKVPRAAFSLKLVFSGLLITTVSPNVGAPSASLIPIAVSLIIAAACMQAQYQNFNDCLAWTK